MIKSAICPICKIESPTKELAQDYFVLELEKNIGLTYAYCTHCDFTYNTTHISENDLAAYYSKRKTGTGLSQSDGDRLHETKRLNFLRRYWGVSEPNNLLEIGPGPGWFLEAASKSFPKTKLYFDEYNELLIDRLKRFGALPINTEDNLMFDVVVMHHVLEHVPNPVDQLQKIKQRLATNGKIMIEVPNHSSVYEYPNGLIFSHLTYFSETALLKLITKAGFALCGLESDITENAKSGAGGQVIRAVIQAPIKIYANMRERFHRGLSLTEAIRSELETMGARKIAILGVADMGIDIAHSLLKAPSEWTICLFDSDKVKVGNKVLGKVVEDQSSLTASAFDAVIIAIINPSVGLVDRVKEAGFAARQIINVRDILGALINE